MRQRDRETERQKERGREGEMEAACVETPFYGPSARNKNRFKM